MLKKNLCLSALLVLFPLPSWAFTNSIGMEFVGIPAGSFLMGTQAPSCPKDDLFTTKDEAADCQSSVNSHETPRHRVAVEGFYMAATEVTQAQWVAVMGSNPSHFKSEAVGDSRHHPVENVSWEDVQTFVGRLNAREGTDNYRLPSEAEWEYAARAGTTTTYSCGDDESCLDKIAWYEDNSDKRTHPVGQKQPNRFGLYDTTGNVWEWVADCWHDSYRGSPTDGSAWTGGCSAGDRVNRGGSWYNVARYCRSAYRFYDSPDFRSDGTIGFRLVRQP